MSPRAFERPATIALSGADGEAGLALEGLLVPSPERDAGGAVIAPPHPLYGGNMEHPVLTEIAHACEAAQYASLRFNWRGVGGSGGEMSGDAEVARADYEAGLAFVEETVDGPLVACGYSFGAATAVAAARSHPRVRRLLLVAPPVAMLDVEALKAFRGSVWIAVGEEDRLVAPDALEQLTGELERGRFVAFPETDHFFQHSVGSIEKAARAWLGA